MKAAGRALTVGELVAEISPPAHPDPLPIYVSDGETEHVVTEVEERSGGGWVLRVPRMVEVDEDVLDFLCDFASSGPASGWRDEAKRLVVALGLA